MTRVDFYVLGAAVADPVATVCKLCDKAAAQGQKVYVRAPPDQQVALDGALWSTRQGSFIAHETWSGQAIAAPQPAVLMGEAEPPDTHLDVLVNLGTDIPAWFGRFERVLELVSGDAAQRAASRVRFKAYRDKGFPLQTHEL
ncbi:MAG: DNA polymerase III subunit chi [Polycyclovorans sp.]|jgi:DNA polymerase-3 subunit chi|nr:DNA polymerase III subunit chi [Polycyclovorans sp.]MBU0790797.1 DNA polymerase III subunit chi [Gammaproteobacteria bacterium]|tara:strand:- start:6703 stop:7128 length:426 start_codon:yes stop_codon:yes gene_type:complete